MIAIPLRDRTGTVVAHALIDDEDEHLTQYKWYRDAYGYAIHGLPWVTLENGKRRRPSLKLHRVIAGLAEGDPREADHVNRDRLDCRRHNLRVATRAENGQNVSSRGRSAQRGVGWVTARGLWTVVLRDRTGKRRYLGSFRDEVDAISAAQAFIAEHQPFDLIGSGQI
jgi:hypothetical protein